MASPSFNEEDPWGAVDPSLVTAGGWSTLVYSALRHHALCDCCSELVCGCLCEQTTLHYEMKLAEKWSEKAAGAYRAWFDTHRRPQIEAEDAEWARQQRRDHRRWRRYHRRRRRSSYRWFGEPAGRTSDKGLPSGGGTGGTPSVPDTGPEPPYNPEDDGVWGG